jgi:serine/threonine protein kinase
MIGRTFPNYRIVAELGAGAMGVVYKALDLRLDRFVALKVLPPEKSGDAERRSRFLQEAKAASALNDPHIVTIHDIFTDEGTDVLVMEFVQGRTLQEVIAGGPLPVPTALDVASQVAEGVGSAHAISIVHRDLKPGNIMLTERGRVKVLDFGLAKLFGDALAQQQTMVAPTIEGTLLGTVDYMSPEQARGEAVDGRSDVFSLGAILYELLTGTKPFSAAHVPGVLHEILFGTLVPPRARRPDVPIEVEAIVSQALERDISRRYQTMDVFARDLRQAQRHLESDAVAASVVVPPPLPRSAPVVPPAIPAAATPAAPAAEGPRPSSRSAVHDPVFAAVSGSVVAGKTVVDAFARSGTNRTDRPKRRSRSRRFLWTIVIFFVLFGPVRQWVTERFRGAGERPENNAGAEKKDDDSLPLPPIGNVPGVGDIGAFVENSVISALESAVRSAPGDATTRVELATLYWRRAQATKDPAFTKRARDMFNEALRIDPDNNEAREGLRQIAASQDDIDSRVPE